MIKTDSDLLEEIIKVLDKWNELNSKLSDSKVLEKIWDITQQR